MRRCPELLAAETRERTRKRDIRLMELRCFWTWPFGHCYHVMKVRIDSAELPTVVPFLVERTVCCGCGRGLP